MPIYEIRSRRLRASDSAPDVYEYDVIPDRVRTQIKMILEDSICYYWVRRGGFNERVPSHNNDGWNLIRNVLCREWGTDSLLNHNGKDDVITFLCRSPDIDNLLDLLEVAFRYIDKVVRVEDSYWRQSRRIDQDPDNAIEELNFRLREAAIGYQFEDGQVIRVDDQFVHAEVVVPALRILSDPRFAGAQEEFLNAHAHYRSREYRDAIADANNAFESTMKAICDIKGWDHPAVATAPNLVKKLRQEGLLPDYLDKSFDQLASTLKSGLPQVRNEEGGHGQGGTPRQTPGYIASYALHLAAAKIIFLVQAMEDAE